MPYVPRLTNFFQPFIHPIQRNAIDASLNVRRVLRETLNVLLPKAGQQVQATVVLRMIGATTAAPEPPKLGWRSNPFHWAPSTSATATIGSTCTASIATDDQCIVSLNRTAAASATSFRHAPVAASPANHGSTVSNDDPTAARAA